MNLTLTAGFPRMLFWRTQQALQNPCNFPLLFIGAVSGLRITSYGHVSFHLRSAAIKVNPVQGLPLVPLFAPSPNT